MIVARLAQFAVSSTDGWLAFARCATALLYYALGTLRQRRLNWSIAGRCGATLFMENTMRMRQPVQRHLRTTGLSTALLALACVAGPAPAQVPRDTTGLRTTVPDWQVKAKMTYDPMQFGLCTFYTITLKKRAGTGSGTAPLKRPDGTDVSDKDLSFGFAGDSAGNFHVPRQSGLLCNHANAGPNEVTLVINYPSPMLAPNQVVAGAAFTAEMPIRRGPMEILNPNDPVELTLKRAAQKITVPVRPPPVYPK